MRHLLVALTALVLVTSWSHSVEAGAVRISQIYVGGGEEAIGTSPFGTDYIELLNASDTAVDVGGWLLAYGGGNFSSTFGCAGCTGMIPANTVIAPCHYLLIQVGYVASPIPAPDIVLPAPNHMTTTGSLGLMSGGSPTGTCLSGPTLQDLVGWQNACSQGSAAPSPLLSKALFRLGDGMTATGNNAADFVVSNAAPRNSASAPSPLCLATPALRQSWGHMKAIYR